MLSNMFSLNIHFWYTFKIFYLRKSPENQRLYIFIIQPYEGEVDFT